MGLEAGVLLSSDSKFTSGGVLSLSKQNRDSSASGGGGKISTSVFDFAALGGLNFRLTQGFSVRLGYKFGLKDVLPDNNFGDYNRMFLAGIRYDFRCKN